jgi:hypothetical protein
MPWDSVSIIVCLLPGICCRSGSLASAARRLL